MEEFNMTFDKIRKIIMDQLAVSESVVTMDTNLMKDLEADSLDAVEIIMAIEDEFGFEIPDEEAEKFQLVGDLVRYVEEHEE
ncbi:MAG: acyl carrier protein [Clostridia bacterium]|nr:acyl carrier protein [Clostridia bacterium]